MSTTSLPVCQSKDVYKPRRPTPDQILQEEGITDWSDKTIMITGGGSGIGVETARAFVKVASHVIIPVRDQSKAQAVVEDIKASAGGKGKITLLTLDLGDLQSVRDCAASFFKLNIPLNILICNAGVMVSPAELKTKDGFDLQFGTNHLGHFLLFELLKEKLLASTSKEFNSRVVMVSSLAHFFGDINWDDIMFERTKYEPWRAYGQSKTANILTAREIEKRYGQNGLHALALHPGSISTSLQRHLTPEAITAIKSKYTYPPNYQKTTQEGAGTTVWAACAKEFEGKGGEYLEDCSHTYVAADISGLSGHAAYAYDETSAQKLYDLSLKYVFP